ncbi:hypothetical protein [Paenibacillus humicola]|uniref:hypothetical protein n=1 Tax=Paenibacillus humicola TaxID=3110540 RepID=UPI00237C4BF9|nr:hypothetical protein [Paenibacillus humicola]
MHTRLKAVMLTIFILLTAAPGNALAYSYGDANTEDVAETFKLVTADLSKSPPDWNGASDAHKARRAEIASHFGEPVAATLDQNISSKNMDDTIANYKAVLVMNLNRRFENTLESIADYSQAKLLLAKAKATFETLKPYAEPKLTPSGVDAIEQDFQTALDAVGNPGLFGVGKKEAEPEKVKAAVNRIYSQLKPLFPYKAAPGESSAGPSEGGAANDAAAGGSQNAPMKRENDTNAAVTFGVIGGVVVIAALAVWWARRKGFF